MNSGRLPLIVTDGFDFYQKVIRRFFGPACLYGQVLKTRRNDRIIKVERRAVHGAAWRFDDALNNSEDSSTLNTSFIERLNLTIRQSSAYLSRRTLSHARSTERLDEHLELLRCYYNFVRSHGALKFGREIRTPAMQAGLTTRRLTFRDIFFATTIPLWLRIEVCVLTGARNPVSSAPEPLPAGWMGDPYTPCAPRVTVQEGPGRRRLRKTSQKFFLIPRRGSGGSLDDPWQVDTQHSVTG